MSKGYGSQQYDASGGMGTASLAVVIGPANIQSLDKFSLLYENINTAANGIVSMTVEVTNEKDLPAANDSKSWNSIASAIIPVPSTLGSGCALQTSAIENGFAWMRVNARASASETIPVLRMTIGGFKIG